MKIIYMGTPDFAVPALEALVKAGYDVALVVTQPDRPKGRGKKNLPTPVKEKAVELGLNFVQPEKIKDNEDFINQIKLIEPDMIIVAAYGRILPKSILEIPKRGCINIHGSLLPKYRGAAPIQRAIMNGEEKTGNTLMYMEEGLDTGDMIAKIEIPIERMNYGELSEKMAVLGAEILLENIEDIFNDNIERKPQNHNFATYSPIIIKEEGYVDFTKGARDTDAQIRGVNPNPGAYTYFEGKKMKIIEAEPLEGRTQEGNGIILDVSNSGITVACGGEKINILKIQMPGKKPLAIKEFLLGNKVEVSQKMGGIADG